MKISILSIGNEILKGTIVNSNTAIIGKEFLKLGITPSFQATVNDDKNDIIGILNYITSISDVIIITGGLGPTTDDLTVKTIADFFNLKLYKDNSVVENIRKRLQHRAIDKAKDVIVSKQNLKQAYVPEGCEVLQNANGTAPGIFIKVDNKRIFLLPGPPFEMKPMLIEKVIPEINSCIKEKIYFEILTTVGIGESDLQAKIDKISGENKDIEFAYRAIPGTCELTIYGKNKNTVQNEADKIRKILGLSVLNKMFNNLIEEVAYYLNKRRLSLSTAESCTGGMIASKITDLPGVSNFFKGGAVVYSNELKTNLLGVKPETLDKFGAVSQECAEEMINGLCKNLKSETGIAITGIAGPDGGTDDKPVGLVYIAVKVTDKLIVKKIIFSGNRNIIRIRTVYSALDILRRMLIEN